MKLGPKWAKVHPQILCLDKFFFFFFCIKTEYRKEETLAKPNTAPKHQIMAEYLEYLEEEIKPHTAWATFDTTGIAAAMKQISHAKGRNVGRKMHTNEKIRNLNVSRILSHAEHHARDR